jgi:hypothetical protein
MERAEKSQRNRGRVTGWIIGTGLFVWAGLPVMRGLYYILQFAGDVDTACSVAGADPNRCSSSVMMGVLFAPPAWLVGLLLVIGALLLIWGGCGN